MHWYNFDGQPKKIFFQNFFRKIAIITSLHTHKHTHPSGRFYSTQKKTMEINPRHPLIKELQRRVSEEEVDSTTSDLAQVLYETALLRSGYVLKDSSDFAGRIERMMRLSLGVDLTAPVSGYNCRAC